MDWDELNQFSSCVETSVDGNHRVAFHDYCETAGGARYNRQGRLIGAYETDDTGECRIRWGVGSFQARRRGSIAYPAHTVAADGFC